MKCFFITPDKCYLFFNGECITWVILVFVLLPLIRDHFCPLDFDRLGVIVGVLISCCCNRATAVPRCPVKDPAIESSLISVCGDFHTEFSVHLDA